jgi:glutamate 5-kinase
MFALQDTVAVQELRFGDNDTLSAQVATLVEADYLFLLTDVDALYTANPKVFLHTVHTPLNALASVPCVLHPIKAGKKVKCRMTADGCTASDLQSGDCLYLTALAGQACHTSRNIAITPSAQLSSARWTGSSLHSRRYCQI